MTRPMTQNLEGSTMAIRQPERRPPPSTTAADRVASIDALRGFDMFWIMGGKPLVLALAAAMIQ
jgi:hypothetical protein